MHVAKKQRKAVFLRGPYDGWIKDFIDEGQKDVRFGEPGKYNDIYERQEKDTPDNKVRFLWNATLSRGMWRQWALENNIDPEMLERKAKPDTVKDGEVVEESPRVRIQVKKNSEKKRWELWVPDRKSTRLNSSHTDISGMPSSA